MSGVYTYFKSEYSNGDFIWDSLSESVKVMLVTTGYNFDADHRYVNEASQYEINGTNYASGYGNAGRGDITTRSIFVSLPDDYVYFRGDNVIWSAIDAGVIGSAIIISERGGSDSSSILIAYINSGGLPLTTNGTTVNLTWNVSGVFRI